MKKKKIFISAPVDPFRGFENSYDKSMHDYLDTIELRLRFDKYDVVNSHRICVDMFAKRDIISTRLRAMVHCDGIYLAKNWDCCSMCTLEKAIAGEMDLLVLGEPMKTLIYGSFT